MTVYDFVDLCIDTPMIEVYSLDAGKVVYSGDAGDMPDRYGEEMLESFDLPAKPGWITVNI